MGGALNCPAQGDAYTDRDGNIIAMHSLQVKINFVRPIVSAGSNAAQPVYIFCALVLDRQPNTVLVGSEQIFQNPSGNLYGSAGGCMQISALSRKRFKVLRTAQFTLNRMPAWDSDTNVNLVSEVSGSLDWYVPLYGRKVVFTGGTGSITACQTNALLLCAWAYDPATPALANDASGVVMTMNSRLRFVG